MQDSAQFVHCVTTWREPRRQRTEKKCLLDMVCGFEWASGELADTMSVISWKKTERMLSKASFCCTVQTNEDQDIVSSILRAF